MRTVKVFALPSHATKERTSGVDFARIIQPMTHLNGYTSGDTTFVVDVYDPAKEELDSKPETWISVAKNYDIIYFNYLNNPWGFAAMGAMARGYGKKLVMDMDDNMWAIKKDNSAYSVYKKGGEAIGNLTSIINEVDFLTVTNSYLKHVVMNFTTKKPDKIKIIDNQIDLSLYDFVPPFKDDGQINLVHHGSTTHFKDLTEPEFVKGIDRIMKEYPNVNLHFIGAFVPRYRQKWGQRYVNSYGHQDVYQWIKGKFRENMSSADIMITPLTNDTYNRSKSGIKYLENSSAKKPGVYQNMTQYSKYITNGDNGYLATTAGDWYKAIKALIDDPKLRERVGQNAYETIQNQTIQENVKEYAELFKSLLDS